MAELTKTEFQTGAYTDQNRKDLRRSSSEQREEKSRYIIAPGLDQFFDFFYEYGPFLLLLAGTYLSFWIIWAVDFSGGH